MFLFGALPCSGLANPKPMIPATFTYHAPASLDEALALLQSHGFDAKLLSGGQSLLPMMKLRLAEPAHIVDINGVPDLDYIREDDGNVCIGALTREAQLASSDLVSRLVPILHDTGKHIADPQVRNLGTVGGNLAHGDPGNDHPATMMALDASVVATGPSGSRVVSTREFFTGFFETALHNDEILTEIRIPVPPARSGGTYLKLERKVGDYATVGVAAQLTVDGAGTCTHAGLGLTNVSSVPVHAAAAADCLVGSKLTDPDIDEAAELAVQASDPSTDLRGSSEYKRAMVRVLARRALKAARNRAQG